MLDWFFVFMGLLSVFYLLSAIYEWAWVLKWERRWFGPPRIWKRNIRLEYLFVATGGLGVAISFELQALFASESVLFFVPGFLSAGALTVALFNTRKGQSFKAFILNREA